MDEEKITVIFGIAEKPVKQLLNSYFELFQQNNLLNICENLGISTRKIPKTYIQHGDLLGLVNLSLISTEFLERDSLLKVPNKNDEMRIIKDQYSENVYLLYLDIVPSNKTWDNEIFTPFGNDQIQAVKDQIGQMMNMVHFVFACLKMKANELNTILLETDPNNITIKIKDSRFPNYDHPLRIGFNLKKEQK